jgi:hypothetical protein
MITQNNVIRNAVQTVKWKYLKCLSKVSYEQITVINLLLK